MKKLLFFLTVLINMSTFGQNSGDIAQIFANPIGFDNTIRVIAQQTDGKILLGGDFTGYNQIGASKIIRLNPDGSRDTSFNIGIGFNNVVNSIVLQSDGKILVGGNFTQYKGVTENRIIRLNIDGSKDTSFSVGTGFDGEVSTIIQQTDNKIIVGGNFVSFNGQSANKIIRLNANGSRDTSFGVGMGFGTSTTTVVLTSAIQTDGKIILAGTFASYNGVPTADNIIRLNSDGTKDSSFNSGIIFSNTARAIAIQNDGKILVVGSFTPISGSTANGIVRLNSDGSNDNSFNTGTGFNSAPFTVVIQSNGKIFVGGSFTSYNGVTARRIIRLNSDGSIDNSFSTGTGFDGNIFKILIHTNGKILVGGFYNSYNNNNVRYLVGLHSEISLSAEDFNKSSFSLYPNPVLDFITLQNPENIKINNYSVLDMNGRILISKPYSVSNEVIDLSSLSKGIYFIQLDTEKGTLSKKIIKE